MRSETIEAIVNTSFNKEGRCRQRRQGGNPRQLQGHLVFDGATDGNRQVDPQIAVGGGYVLHATNLGLIIYTKQGAFVQGVSQNCFNGGIDPKLFYDSHNRMFAFDLWNPWDRDQQKPVNISVSASADPRGKWFTYPVPAPAGVDGGGIGYSRRWIGYTYPGRAEQTFVLPTKQAKAGGPVTVYHFAEHFGQPVYTQDPLDALYFLKFGGKVIEIRRVTGDADGLPRAELVGEAPHGLQYAGFPPRAPQRGTEQEVAAGDRRPKNVVLQGSHLWFSHTVNVEGRAAVQWHQLQLDGTIVQSGLLSHPVNSYIQTTIAVNQRLDLLVGFQETGPETFISPRFAYRRCDDPVGQLRPIVSIGEGRGATDGVSWGDYSGSVVDGDNQLDLWTIQSITDASGKGDTVIARLSDQTQQ